ncbi:vanadium-dependent haloperoxidase [Hymenobacter terricola]|uniref:vanadium-dependent haloperoxidase n=1 Tax=Hymenobacter terricola TaxID=2819236 RepID=UPI001B315555|nr:vanadium-dependent haloperoxidase [Hymenobacter terricola]
MRTITSTFRLGAIGRVGQLLIMGCLMFNTACSDNAEPAPDPSPATDSYRADVAVTWLNMQLKLARTTPVTTANVFGRPFAYAGIVGYEAVVPGMAGYRSLAGQLNGLAGMPATDKSQVYNWPLSANAALAAISRTMFANASPANLATMDSLEAANKTAYQASLAPEVVSRSIDFGKKVAGAVFEWSKTDGYDNPAVYTPPTGPGMWVPTPPAFGPPIFPFWGSNRPLVAGSGDGADPGPPLAYSTTLGSPFQLMVKEVLDIAQARTAEQTAIALFWNDVPNGRSFTPPGHWVSILAQVLSRENAPLDKAVLAYAKLGMYMNDATISCLKAKYTYNLLRPVSYIRSAMGQPTWSPLIPTPGHPEYSAGHATVSSSAAEALTEVFGPSYAFTDQNYAQFGLGSRSYTSFEQAAAEAGISRLYGGIHYRPSIEKGLVQGKKVGQTINAKLVFK